MNGVKSLYSFPVLTLYFGHNKSPLKKITAACHARRRYSFNHSE
ncbi:hypothetical protein [Psychrobacter fozii]|nr:hypothetical protein [Psychrobacter fozii]